jgi:hypothetical protein
LGKDLYVGGVEVKNLYELLGEPTVGIDMPEVVDNKDGGEKENRIRRAQRALENAFRAQGITTVDVTGVDKSKQREICDILVTGTSQATLRSQASLPGGTKPVYVYNCEMEIAVQLSPTNKQILANIYALKPMGDDAKKMMDFDSAEAAKKVMEANVANNIDAINKAMIDEWVKLSGDVDFWVGISGLEGGMDMLNVKKELKSIPGVKKVVPRYYKDGTQFVGLVYAENAQKLIEAMVQAGYKLTEMRGTKMIFKNKK